MYPIHDDIIFCKPTIFKAGSELVDTHTTSILVTTPVRSPRIIRIDKSFEYQDKQDAELMITKIRNVFNIAESRGYNTLVLPDFGCQDNPIRRVIDIINDQLSMTRLSCVIFYVQDYDRFLQFHSGIRRQ